MNNQNDFFLSTYLDKNPDLLLNNLLEQSVVSVENSLQQFANEPDFTDKMQLAFGKNADGSYLRTSWEIGDFIFPQIEVVATADINGANGAYARQKNKIYLAQEFLLANQLDIDVIAAVLLEEYGHFVDREINLVDAEGDEGAIFSALVRGERLSESELQQLKNEVDSAVLIIDREEIEIEQNINSQDIEIIQITNNSRDDDDPSISGNKIVWQRDDEEIVLYDIETKTTRVINNGGSPSIFGNNIVYQNYNGDNEEIANPDAGIWDIQVTDETGLGEVNYFATRDSNAPTIDIIEPSQTVPGGEVEITFDAFDADSEANISLFYDDDGEGFDGIQIVDGLIEQDGRGNYTWNTAGVATGEIIFTRWH